jgi:methyl-accepting chemotaxis protein
MKNVSALTKDFRATDHKVDKLLDNPAFGADLKDAFQTAKQTAEKIQSAIHELNATVNDKAVRDDMIVMLNKLADSTERIRDSMTLAKGMSDDTQLRSDVRDIVVTARDAMRKADDILGNPNFINDARLTMSKLQKASDSVDRASTNINRIIGSRHPIIHLFLNSNKPEKQKIEITTSGPGEKPVVEVTHP